MSVNKPQKKNWKVLLVGRYFCDLVFTGLPELPRLGHEVYSRDFHLVPGGVYTPAVALTRLGVKVAWSCEFGSDLFSRFVRNEALKENVDPAFFTNSPEPSLRLTVAFSFGSERAFLSYTDPMPRLPYARLIKELQPEWLYITHLMVGTELKELVSAAQGASTKVYMDCQAHNRSLEEPEVRQALASVDIFSPNLEEARRLAGEDDAEKTLAQLARIAPMVIIKLGQDGCICRRGDEVVCVPGTPVEVVDTTGAGDNFNSGFLYGQLYGYSLEDSLRIGNICGALSTEGYGGASTSPSSTIIRKVFDI